MNYKNLFQLRDDVVFLNHGSFGACPVEIMDDYQRWQKIIESQPVEHLGRMHYKLLFEARQRLGMYMGANPDDLVFVTNATTALNIVAWSIDLKPGDEVITTDLEYGAMDRMWEFICQKKGAKYIKVPVLLPIIDDEDFLNQFRNYFTTKTKILFSSMITSSTALRLPIEKLCDYAKSVEVLTIIDGAHVPGQIDIKLDENNFDFFTGNCHKWMCAPKGTAFLYAKPDVQKLLNPLIISWGNLIDPGNNTDFINNFEYLGTRDISAFLTIGKCIEFMNKYINGAPKAQINELLQYAANGIQQILKTDSIIKNLNPQMQMYAHSFPAKINAWLLKDKLYEDFRIEIPISKRNSDNFMRVSIQIYNTKDDVDFFLDKLEYLITQREFLR